MKLKTFALALITTFAIVACSQSHDFCRGLECGQTYNSCSDLEGTITHSTIEITGIESASIFKLSEESNALEAVDQFNGTEFSNLIIEIDLSWIDEQHRLNTTNTIIQSFLDWFLSPTMACSLIPYYEEYQPAVSDLQIYSDNDFNADYIAGSDLTQLFTATDSTSGSNLFVDNANGISILSARSYTLQSVWMGRELATIPTTPRVHVFTINVSLEDGRAFEIRTPAVLLSGI